MSDMDTDDQPQTISTLMAALQAPGEWPRPELYQQFIEAGEEVNEPLVAFLEGDIENFHNGIPLEFAIEVLGERKAIAAVEPIASWFLRGTVSNTFEKVQHALQAIGRPAYETALATWLEADNGSWGSHYAFRAAANIGLLDPELKNRTLDILRQVLKEYIQNRSALTDPQLSIGQDIMLVLYYTSYEDDELVEEAARGEMLWLISLTTHQLDAPRSFRRPLSQ